MKPLIVANWKCNPDSLKQAKKIIDIVKKGIKSVKGAEVMISPPYIYLPEMIKRIKGNNSFKKSRVKVGGENCFWEKGGSYTGEISARMLKDLGCDFVIIGHSERRRYFKETDKIVNKKVTLALEAKLKVILCIGETEQEKNKGDFSKVIESQIKKGLKKVPRTKLNQILIAYEPIWAIGSGKSCKPVEVQITSLLVRKILTKIYSREKAEKVPVLYGGSVNQDNALDYLREGTVKGLLIGGASLRPKEFVRIVKDASNF